MTDLTGLRALVTGGASGIGRAISHELLKRGGQIAVLDQSDERPADLASEILYVVGDIGVTNSVDQAVASVIHAFGGLDILINNAGIGSQGSVADHSDEDWRAVLEINVIGTARVCRAAWPALIESRSPSIVNISSVAATAGLPERAIYSASKGAVSALTRSIAADGMPHSIRANSVNPGTADTPWVQRLLASANDPIAERTALEARQPHGRLVLAQEIADAVAYLASPTSGSTTGIEIPVDGGMSGLRLRSRTQS